MFAFTKKHIKYNFVSLYIFIPNTEHPGENNCDLVYWVEITRQYWVEIMRQYWVEITRQYWVEITRQYWVEITRQYWVEITRQYWVEITRQHTQTFNMQKPLMITGHIINSSFFGIY